MRFIRVKSVIIVIAILVTNLWGGVTINAIDVTTPSIETYWDIQLQTPNLGKYKFVIQAKEKPNTNKYKILKTVDSSYYPTTTMSYIKEVDNPYYPDVTVGNAFDNYRKWSTNYD